MKTLLLVGLVFASTAFAATENWVEINDYVSVTSTKDNTTATTRVYLDVANATPDASFVGYSVKFVFVQQQTATMTDHSTAPYTELFLTVEYDCAAHKGRGKRNNMLALTDGRHTTFGEDWREIPDDSTVAKIMFAVKDRACHGQ